MKIASIICVTCLQIAGNFVVKRQMLKERTQYPSVAVLQKIYFHIQNDQ
jgi:hypothetical protein